MRTLDLETLHLYSGSHNPDGKMCVMEAVAYVAGEPWSDAPACSCPVLGAFLRDWNDDLDDATRQRLRHYIRRLVGTRDGNELRRSWMAFDWLTRECGPAFMDLTPALVEHAVRLRALPEIVDHATLDAAKGQIETALRAAAAARSAAVDAAGTAAGAAAWAAAGRTLAPVVAHLQDSAFALLDRMLSLPKAAGVE